MLYIFSTYNTKKLGKLLYEVDFDFMKIYELTKFPKVSVLRGVMYYHAYPCKTLSCLYDKRFIMASKLSNVTKCVEN